MCYVIYFVQRSAGSVRVQLQIAGEETPGSDEDWSKVNCVTSFADGVDETIAAAGSECLCVEQEGGAEMYWDMANGTIRVWSALCPTMHINDVSAFANAGGCGGDEEKIQVDITVHDSDDVAIDNARIEITLTGAVEDVVFADTDAFGDATYLSDCLCVNGTINVEVTNLTKGGYIWNSDDDEDALTDSILMDCT